MVHQRCQRHAQLGRKQLAGAALILAGILMMAAMGTPDLLRTETTRGSYQYMRGYVQVPVVSSMGIFQISVTVGDADAEVADNECNLVDSHESECLAALDAKCRTTKAFSILGIMVRHHPIRGCNIWQST